jgi:hypothetical protein
MLLISFGLGILDDSIDSVRTHGVAHAAPDALFLIDARIIIARLIELLGKTDRVIRAIRSTQSALLTPFSFDVDRFFSFDLDRLHC